METYCGRCCRYVVRRIFIFVYRFFGGDMKAKMVIMIGYRSFVMDADRALKVIDLLHDAERYEQVWVSATPEAEAHTAHHAYPNDSLEAIEVKLLPAEVYAIAKLRGKPDSK